jgi:xanthine phosphoribosyltransferase
VENDWVISWEEIHRDATKLAYMIQLSETEYDGIIAITKGGMYPALIVSNILGINHIDTIGIKSYSDDRMRKKAHLIKPPPVNSFRWLVIDDLTDTGKTIEMVKLYMVPISFNVATLYTKPMGNHMVNFRVKEVEQDTWIVFPWEKDHPLNEKYLREYLN